ncbi:ATP synthase subunit I [Congregibacter sp.]|uniref:ATP synthase subunit I n=1 Tax=Congregibacter sp. TaxID=2744308 RepID=UPI003F6B8F51
MAQERVGEKAVQAARKTPLRPHYLRTTLFQVILLFILAPITFLVAGLPSAVSLACGAMCAMLPQAYFAVRITAAARQSARQAARLGLSAEVGKLVLSAVAFALVFAVLKPSYPGLVFAGFGLFWVVQIVDGVRLLVASNNGNSKTR